MVMNKRRGRGRPAGRSTAREDILEVARRRFVADGYAGVSMRAIAAEAGVDPALISYHFGSKRGLFGAALELSMNPALVLAQVLDAPADVLPERLLRALLAVWDHPEHGAQLVGLLRGVVSDAETALVFREVVEREILGRIAERLGGRDASARASAMAVQLGGLIFLRHVLRVEPVASMSADELVAAVLPALRVAGRLPPPAGPGRPAR